MIFSAFISAFRSCNIWNFQCWVHVQVEIGCGATPPSCTTAIIMLSAHNKLDHSYQNSCIFAYYTYFHVSYRTLGRAFGKSTKESYRTGEHFYCFLAFRKIHRRIRSPRMESLEIRTERTFVNTKHNWSSTKLRHRPLFVRHYRAKYFLTQPLNMCSIILLKRKKLEAITTVISSLILHWLIKLLLNVTFRIKLKCESKNHWCLSGSCW